MIRAAAVAAALACLLLPACRADDASIASSPSHDVRRVERVVDGDTVVLLGGERVRMLGIDTLEMRSQVPVGRELAREARAALESAVRPGVILSPATRTKDQYDRTLAYLARADDGSDVGAELLRSGLARCYPTSHERLEAYLALEADARSRRVGMWREEAREAVAPRADVVIGVAEVPSNVGRLARVEGRVASVRRTPRALFMTLSDGGAEMTVVAFPHAFPLLPEPLIERWAAGRVGVTGRITTYRGAPQIVLDRPDQVTVLEPVGAASAPAAR